MYCGFCEKVYPLLEPDTAEDPTPATIVRTIDEHFVSLDGSDDSALTQVCSAKERWAQTFEVKVGGHYAMPRRYTAEQTHGHYILEPWYEWKAFAENGSAPLRIFRMRVDGGWLYAVQDKPPAVGADGEPGGEPTLTYLALPTESRR